MAADFLRERLARAQEFLSRDEHEAAWQELSRAEAVAQAQGDAPALRRIAELADILAARTKGSEKVRAEALYRDALGVSPAAEGSTAAVRTVDWRHRSFLVRDVAVFSMLGGFILSGWLGYVVGRLGDGFDQGQPVSGIAPVAWSLARGAVDAFLVLLVVGSIRYLIRVRGEQPGKSWEDLTFAGRTMGFALVALYLWYSTG